MTRPRVAVGPVMPRPSWHWVGADVMRGARHCEVLRFKNEAIPPCDLVVWVKARPKRRVLDLLARRGTRLVYVPVDEYERAEQIEADAAMLRQCATVLLHCERLAPFFRSHTQRVESIDHHNRFGLEGMATYKASGPLLWVGSWPYAEHLCRFLKNHGSPEEVLLLTENPAETQKILARFGLEARCRSETWSAESQRAALESCRAALDIKGTSFHQLHKPPTKAQKYVCSGVPFATNEESFSYEYFQKRGFSLAKPTDRERWFSEEYWREIRAAGESLREELTPEAVSRRYREIIDATLR